MLIECDRLTDLDRQIWTENEYGDAAHAARIFRRVDQSRQAIAEFLAEGSAYIGVSWGKDSVAALCLTLSVCGTIPVVNLRCTNRNPFCDAVRDCFLATIPCNYQEYEVDYSGVDRDDPEHVVNKVTDGIWDDAWRRVASDLGVSRYISGMRSSESATRAMRCMRWWKNSNKTCSPLAWWTSCDVFAFLFANQLPVHPAYAMTGGGRWPRENIRVAEIGDTRGSMNGRSEWEMDYFPMERRMMQCLSG